MCYLEGFSFFYILIYLYTYILIYLYTYINISINKYIYIYIYIHIYIYMCVCVYVYMYIYIYIYLYIYICVYIYRYMQYKASLLSILKGAPGMKKSQATPANRCTRMGSVALTDANTLETFSGEARILSTSKRLPQWTGFALKHSLGIGFRLS